MPSKSLLRILTFLMLALVVTACSKSSSKFEAIGRGNGDWLIINGKVVEADDPDMRSVVIVFSKKDTETNSGTICSATLIAPNLVLTAAHCIHKDKPVVEVMFGTQLNKSESRRVSAYVVHKGYEEIDLIMKVEKEERTEEEGLKLMYGAHDDLALLKFEGTVPEGYEPAKLFKDSNLLVNGYKVLTAGYGITDLADRGSNGVLNKFETRIMLTPTNEKEFMIDIREGGTCFGDSGGPVFMKIKRVYHLIGVTSRTLDNRDGEVCKMTASITDVSKYSEWIQTASEKLLATETAPEATATESELAQ